MSFHSVYPPVNEFLAYQQNADTPVTNFGATIVPGVNDVKGNWTGLMGGIVAEDTYGILLQIHSSNSANNARPILVDIGLDVAGGSSYQVLIPNLNASMAANPTEGNMQQGGFHYFFPLFVKKGSGLAARAQVGNATANTLKVFCRLYQKPTHPELCRVGSWVSAVGIDTTNSRGTAVTPGANAAEGSWASLGTIPRTGWWLQASHSIDDSSLVGVYAFLDIAIGDSTNKRTLILNQSFFSDSNESMSGALRQGPDCANALPIGQTLWARVSNQATVGDTNTTAMAYVMG